MAGDDLSGLFPGDDDGGVDAADDRITQRIPAVANGRLPAEVSPDEVARLRDAPRGGPAPSDPGLAGDQEASNYVGRYLFPTERFRGEWRKHWIHIFYEYLIAAVATFLLGLATGWLAKNNQRGWVGLIVVIWLIVIVVLAWRVVDWYYDRFVLTNKRIMVVSGLVSRTVGMMPLVRVTDMKFQQSAMGRILNYGTFVVESAGLDQALRAIPHMRRPNEIYLRIVEEMYEPEAVEARLSRMTEDSAADL